jgi:hypothetical protein
MDTIKTGTAFIEIGGCVGCGEPLPAIPAMHVGLQQGGKAEKLYFRKPTKHSNYSVRVCGQTCALTLDALQDFNGEGTEGQDRESYSDTQDRENYTIEEEEE